MTRPIPFDPDAARAALPAWNWREPAPVSGVLAGYARFYGLDDLAPAGVACRHGIGVLPAAGYRIALQSWRLQRPRGTVLVLHGYYDHLGIFGHVIARVLASGYDVLAFDLPGHGLSSGEPATIGDFAEYQDVLHDVLAGLATLPRPWYVVAQSTGGAILMDYLLANRLDRTRAPLAGATLLAPLVRPVHWRVNSAVHAVVSLFRDRIARKFAVNSHDDAFLRFLREDDPLQARHLSVRWVGALKRWIPRLEAQAPLDYPLRVVQGDEDRTVDGPHNLGVIRAKFPAAVIRVIPGGRHQLANEAPAWRDQALAVVDDMLAGRPDPAGANEAGQVHS